MAVHYSIGEFAKKTGTTIRTLHYYDEIGLLQPAFISPSGRRHYSDDNIIQLQKVISLKFLGYSLEEINEFIHLKDWDLKDSLSFQKQKMEQKKDQIDRVIRALDHALEIMENQNKIDSAIFITLIQNLLMEPEHKAWLKEYLPADDVEKMYNLPDEKSKELNKRAAEILGSLKQAYGDDPASKHVQKLIGDYFDLSEEIYGDIFSFIKEIAEKDIQIEDDPSLFSSPFTKDEEEWLSKVMEMYLLEKGVYFHEED